MSTGAAVPFACRTGAGDRTEHVLVVDDDEMVRESVVRQVASLGYRVSEAPNGPAGLDIVRACADIDLLFTDIVMPGGMSGYDLAEAAERLRPDVRILFTSGYSEDITTHGSRLVQSVEMLQKPYRRQDLAQCLRRALDR